MPRYFFHSFNDKALIDTDGVDLADKNAVRREALRAIGEILVSAEVPWSGAPWRMIVVDEAGSVVVNLKCTANEHWENTAH